jgi:hypothetical protein
VHEGADGVVDQKVRPHLLDDPVRILAAQHHPRAALELIQRGLVLPPLRVQRRQLGGGRALRVGDRGQQPVVLRLARAAGPSRR